ncbi:unnamed protein product [Peronospora farinosa]|uniref:Uncharacterized protein n=1 Tax=Peronospora farinosa TaxID=134698 RepID=A0AAV0UI17_9STRA|nr:unnamed protein product [Peronospora farinosa]
MSKEKPENSKRLLRTGLKPSSVLDVIRSDLADEICLVAERDIVNIQQSECVQELDGLTELEALKRNLNAYDAKVKTRVDGDGHLTHLLIIPHTILELL